MMSVFLNTNVAINVIFNMLKAENKDGKKAGDPRMKITKLDLKRMILETLNELNEPEEDPTKLTSRSMAASQFARSGMETRKAASAELTAIEKGIVDQIDQFLLDLAEQPGVDLVTHKMLIQRVMKILQDKLGAAADSAGSNPDVQVEPQQGDQG